MKDTFEPLFEAISKAGFNRRLENAEGEQLDFKFTQYSLNDKLSFRFENFDHFIEFLETSGNPVTQAKHDSLQTAFVELGHNPNEFFWVNFFEAGKEEEM